MLFAPVYKLTVSVTVAELKSALGRGRSDGTTALRDPSAGEDEKLGGGKTGANATEVPWWDATELVGETRPNGDVVPAVNPMELCGDVAPQNADPSDRSTEKLPL